MRENIHITLNINCRIIDNLGQILGFLKKTFLFTYEREREQAAGAEGRSREGAPVWDSSRIQDHDPN